MSTLYSTGGKNSGSDRWRRSREKLSRRTRSAVRAVKSGIKKSKSSNKSRIEQLGTYRSFTETGISNQVKISSENIIKKVY